MRKFYAVIDMTAGGINKLLTESELIGYANGAHFVRNGECEEATDVHSAICILNTDFFEVKEVIL